MRATDGRCSSERNKSDCQMELDDGDDDDDDREAKVPRAERALKGNRKRDVIGKFLSHLFVFIMKSRVCGRALSCCGAENLYFCRSFCGVVVVGWLLGST